MYCGNHVHMSPVVSRFCHFSKNLNYLFHLSKTQSSYWPTSIVSRSDCSSLDQNSLLPFSFTRPIQQCHKFVSHFAHAIAMQYLMLVVVDSVPSFLPWATTIAPLVIFQLLQPKATTHSSTYNCPMDNRFLLKLGICLTSCNYNTYPFDVEHLLWP